MDGFDVENSPLVNLLDTVLTEYNTHLRALLGSLDTEGNRNLGVTASQSRHSLSRRLISLDQSLQTLYHEIDEHQKRQEEIRKTQLLSIRSGKAQLQFINSLLTAQTELEEAIADADRKLGPTSEKLEVQEVIEYANRLSKFTAAPPNYDPQNSAVPPEPPYPVLVAMRAGVLNRYRAKKTAKDKEVEEDVDEGGFAHMEEDQFDDVDADDLLLSLDLNPDLD